jgi:hypothetical protein
MAAAACSGLANVSGPLVAGDALLAGDALAMIKAAAIRPSTPYRIGVADAEFILVLPSIWLSLPINVFCRRRRHPGTRRSMRLGGSRNWRATR